jgi:ubiquinone/menaquinone biosynthesis C-methylase UbiE
VISGFGLKTFNDKQLVQLANEIDRILKPNGKFSLIDVSVPKIRILKPFYMFYLKNIIPILGKVFLGSPET